MRRLAVVWVVAMLLMPASAAWPAGSRTTEVTVEQARTLLHARGGKPDFIILDVRTPGEFAGGHLPGAVNMDVQSGDFETRLGALDRGKAYLVYCRSGNRSRRAIQAMERMRFESVYHLSEGMLGWEKK